MDASLIHQQMAHHIAVDGLHRGDQFATSTPAGPVLDICALAYVIAEHSTVPDVFYTDEVASIALIEASEPAMATIRAISITLDPDPTDPTAPCTTNGRPDPIEHVSNWAATASPVHPKRPPTTSEVIGRILRAANTLATQTPTIPAA